MPQEPYTTRPVPMQTSVENGPTLDARVEVILKEYEALRAEILFHLQTTSGLANAATTLAGGILAGAALLQGSLLALDHYVQVSGLIVISFLFSSLLLAGFSHDRDMALIAQYIYSRLRPSLSEILNTDIDQKGILDWDVFHQEIRFTNENGKQGNVVGLSGLFFDSLVGLSRYALPYLIGLATLVTAAVVYVLYLPLPPTNIFGWGAMVLWLLAMLPLIMVIPVAIGIQRRFFAFRSTRVTHK